jgi:hypothetical protein
MSTLLAAITDDIMYNRDTCIYISFDQEVYVTETSLIGYELYKTLIRC